MRGVRRALRLLPALVLLPAAAAVARCGGAPDLLDPHAGLPAAAPPGPPGHAEPAPPAPADAGGAAPAPRLAPELASPVEFGSRIRPLLQERCGPCHFPGGVMHDRLPFDSEETVRSLGRALFTRIRDADSRALLEAFLESAPGGER